ncbi:MAG: TfoX/Sxy family protein [Holophagales bacterium]|jgi:TfoX/Sxy family transcriptional regulator of competence genes|nr:TfoX/Sxy family protein [Holophagales bacterium]
MATTVDFIEYVCTQIDGIGAVRHKKMFGEYMVYVNNKPILLVCNSTVYVKILPCLAEFMSAAEKGFPYKGAKEHYILDIDDTELVSAVVTALEQVIPVPKPKKKKTSKM